MYSLYTVEALSLFCAGLIGTFLLLPILLTLIERAQIVRPNYRGDLIPVCAGLIFFLVSFFIAGVYYYHFQDEKSTFIFLLTVVIFSGLGFLDDTWGSREISGLTGHARFLLQGRLSTGALKALGGIVCAVLLSFWLGPWYLIPVNTLAIALSANAVNLLDLRPGRAGKGFLLLAVIFLWVGWGQEKILLLVGFLGCLLGYLRTDLQAKAMMGDTGSNPAGAVLGVSAVWALKEPYLIVYLVFLIFIHLLAEKFSLTGIIARNRILNYLDRLGRGGCL